MATRLDPYRNFRFQVKVNGIKSAGFSEATIPDTTIDNIEYREGNDPPHMMQASGLTKYGNLTLKRGMTDSMDMFNWLKKVEQTGAEGNRQSITVTIIDEKGKEKATWNLRNAWPIKYEEGGLEAKGNDILLETLELVHEGIERTK